MIRTHLKCFTGKYKFSARAHTPLDHVLLLLDSLPQRVAQCDLGEVLQGGVDGVADGVVEHTLHTTHQHLQPLDHGNDLNPNRSKASVTQNHTQLHFEYQTLTSTRANFSSLV